MAANKVGAKRSLFKKPAWASTSTKIADDDAPIFGQSQHYSEILETKRARREKLAAKQLEKAEKDRQQEQEQQSKRRRISKDVDKSEDDSDIDSRSARSASVSSQRSQKSITPVEVEEEEYKEQRATPQNKKKRLIDRLDTARSPQTRSKKTQPTKKDHAIVLNDNDEEDEAPVQVEEEDDDMYGPPKSRPKKKAQPQFEEESEEEDEYLRELKAKAREEARSKKLSIGAGKEQTPASPSTQVGNEGHSAAGPNSASPDNRLDLRASRATSTPAGDDEAEVKIWIKTIIPGAKEVIVNRKINQPLDKVKEFWIKRNELEPSIAERVFFTWKGTRLYNSTTMRGIIERLKKTHPTRDGSDPSNGQITIEAVTDEIFEYRAKQRARRLAEVEAGTSLNDEGGDNNRTDSHNNNDTTAGDDGNTAPQAQKPSGIVIKLKAQGLEEMSIRVRPDTTMGKILNGFCKLRNVDPGLQKWLSYDGDKLDEDTTVDEVGFEHDDTVEVYLR